MVFWFGFFEVVNAWVPCSFRNYKKRCVPLRLRSSIRISLEICFDWKSEIEDWGQGAIIRQWWSQFPRSFCPTVLHRAGILLELKRTTLFGGSRKIINCPPIRLLFSFTKLDALRIDVNRCKLLTKLKLTMKSYKVWELWSTMNNLFFSQIMFKRSIFNGRPTKKFSQKPKLMKC